MVGRTPEYLGKKVEAREIKLVSLGILITPLTAMFCTALGDRQPRRASVDRHGGRPPALRDSRRRSTRICPRRTTTARRSPATRATSSRTRTRRARVTFADILGGFDMLFARYAPILFALAVAGALAGKRVSPAGLGTMRTDNATFVVLLIGVIVLVGALTFFPALLLGPIVQGLTGHLY